MVTFIKQFTLDKKLGFLIHNFRYIVGENVMLIRMDEILKVASKEGYAVPAPNVMDLNSVKWCFEVAREQRAPLIIDCAGHFIPYEELGELTKFYATRIFPEVPTALNLDHGQSIEQALGAIRAGFTSVMVDKSKIPDEENARVIKEVVNICHSVNVSVEAEIGHVGQGENYESEREAGLTNVDTAIWYVKETGVDCLAVAVGTSHGAYLGTPKIDFDRIVALKNAVSTPLVMHGGSFTGDENLVRSAKLGIAKINVFAELSLDAMNNAREILKTDLESRQLALVVGELKRGYCERLSHYMQMLGATNRW